MELKQTVAKLIKLDGVSESEIFEALAPTPDINKGDICLPCFKFSRALRLAPPMIASKIKEQLDQTECDFIQKVEVEGGYLNVFYDRNKVVSPFMEKYNEGNLFDRKPDNGKTVCIDYSSINIAKPFHIGHLLTTVIGGSLYRIYRHLGYKTVGINHLGDWGTQFGKMISAYLRWGNDEDIEKRGVKALLDLYVKFHDEAEKDESLNDEGRAYFKKIEDGDEQALAIFTKFKEITLKEVNRIYDRLGVEFDSYAGESFYIDKVQPVIDELREKNLLCESEGAQVVNLDEYDMAPCIILKSDGTTIYATRDLAAAMYRKNTYDFYKNLYVVAYQQNLHFKQVFKTLELMGREWANDCVHVPFGMVSLEGQGSLSTRKGNVVFLEEVLDTAVDKAKSVIENKNPNIENKDEIASMVGVGAVVFGALCNSRIKDISFSLDKALSFEGETAPYLQYTHARCCSVIARAQDSAGAPDYSTLVDNDSFALVMHLAKFDSVVEQSALRYEPSMISSYLLDLAKLYNKFYLSNRILGEETAVLTARLDLTKAVRDTLKTGLSLLLIGAPEKR